MDEPVIKFDLTSPAYKANPFPILEQVRTAGPIVRTKLPIIGKLWLVTSYEAINEVLRNHKQFVREARNAGKNKYTDIQWWMGKIFRAPAENMLAKDEPDHRRLRGLVDDAFLRRSVEGMRDRVSTLADQVLDEALENAASEPTREAGEFDFLVFARQFPLAVITELLGLPPEDREKFTRWASGIANVSSLPGLLGALPNMFRISSYFRRQFKQYREQPDPDLREGLLSLLVEVERSGDSLSEEELTAMAFLLLFAGHETTTHMLSTGLLSLLDHPDQKAALMADWSQGEAAVDEMLRFNTPIQFTKPRIASEDMELYGKRIKQGQYLLPLIAAGNCDPDQFDDPRRFDIARSPNPHLSFGAGIHVCLGMKLAKLEGAIAFQRLLTRFPNLELATTRDQLVWTKRIGTRALSSLPIRLNAS